MQGFRAYGIPYPITLIEPGSAPGEGSALGGASVQVRMDGSHGCGTDLRMSMPASTGAFFRSSSKPDGTLLLMGAHLPYIEPSFVSDCNMTSRISWAFAGICATGRSTEWSQVLFVKRNEDALKELGRNCTIKFRHMPSTRNGGCHVSSGAAGAPAEVMNAHRLSVEALTAAQAAGNGTLLDNFRDIHHEVHRRAVEGNRCAHSRCHARGVHV